MLRWLYSIHKWLAVVACAATLGWFTSGMVMLLPASWLTLSPTIRPRPDVEARLPGAPGWESATLPPATAVSAVAAFVGKPLDVISVELRRFPGRIAYQVTTISRGSHLVDAQSGVVFSVDERLARQIAARFRQSEDGLGPEPPISPALADQPKIHRIRVAGWKGTTFEVASATGETKVKDHLIRAAGAVTSLHTFGFLRGLLPDRAIRVLMLAVTTVGICTTIAGILILIVQARRWWHRLPGTRPSGAE